MTAAICLLVTLVVCIFSIHSALNLVRQNAEHLRVLERQVDFHTGQDQQGEPILRDETARETESLPMGGGPGAIQRDIESLLSEVFQEENAELSRAAIEQLLGYCVMFRERVAAVRRGLMRIPSLFGAAAAIFIVAAVGHRSAELRFALAAVGSGVATAFGCQLILARARRLGQRFSELVQAMSRELERAHGRGSAHVR